MKTLKKSIMILFAFSLFFVFGCEKNLTSPDETSQNKLTDAEQMVVVATEVSGVNGGLMTDLAMVESAASGQPGSLNKVVSYDTTITVDWINYSLQLYFYAANGNEQPFYIENRTDKIAYEGSLTGIQTFDDPNQQITLKRNSTFEITNIISDTIVINGTSWNKSDYLFQYNDLNLEVKPSGTVVVKNLKIDLNSDTFIPFSGTIEANMKGKYSKQGKFNQNETDYDFICTVEFTGAAYVVVTLPSGTQYRLNLLTGDFAKIS
jgi:hypothetical protein